MSDGVRHYSKAEFAFSRYGNNIIFGFVVVVVVVVLRPPGIYLHGRLHRKFRVRTYSHITYSVGEFEWRFYTLSVSKAIFRVRTYSHITYSVGDHEYLMKEMKESIKIIPIEVVLVSSIKIFPRMII